MSAVRMCDRCGVIFPETAEGWGVGTISTNVPRADGRGMRMEEQRIDLCPVDNAPANQHLSPQLQVARTSEAERLAMVKAAVKDE